MDYTPVEYCDMLIICGECGQNALRAAREYNIRCPERRRINYKVGLQLLNRSRETRSLMPNRRINAVVERRARTVQNEEAILQSVDGKPNTSIREMSQELQISKSTIQCILKENRFHAYHFTKVQNLLPRDYEARVRSCTWLINKEENQPGFVNNILFTDESCFTRDGVFNTHNTHLWANENPNGYHIKSFQYRFKINLWAGILNTSIIGPFEMPANITGHIYTNFLETDLFDEIENLPLEQRRQMFFQHDGVPSHATLRTRQVLDASYPDRWIGRGGPIHWPVRSPDLTPLDFFLWGTIKQYIYKEHINRREELEEKIIEAFAITPEMVHNAQRSLLQRARLCIQCDGGHFEHLL